MAGHAALQRLRAAQQARIKREAHNQKTFGWLKLPTELRNIIYDMVLSHDQVIWPGRELNAPLIRKETTSPPSSSTSNSHSASSKNSRGVETIYINLISPSTHGDQPLPLAQITRLTRAEVLRYYYGSNTWILSIHDDLIQRTTTWLRTRPPEAFSVLERVILQDWSFPKCPQLLDFTIACPCCILVLGLNLYSMELDFPVLGIEDPTNDCALLEAGLCEWCMGQTKRDLGRRKRHVVFRRLRRDWEEQGPGGERIVQLVRWWKEYSKERPQARVDPFEKIGMVKEGWGDKY